MRNLIPKQCGICKTPFRAYSKTHLYCSKECRSTAHKRWKKRHGNNGERLKDQHKRCAQCGEAFNTRKELQRFCSRKCNEKYAGIARTTKRRANPPKRQCTVCRKSFHSSREIYCSVECRKKRTRERNTANNRRKHGYRALPYLTTCVICQKSFMRTAPMQNTCSELCYYRKRAKQQYESRARVKARNIANKQIAAGTA